MGSPSKADHKCFSVSNVILLVFVARPTSLSKINKRNVTVVTCAWSEIKIFKGEGVQWEFSYRP